MSGLGGIKEKPEGISNAELINVECRSWGGWEEAGAKGKSELVDVYTNEQLMTKGC